jgi:hypothetical protein
MGGGILSAPALFRQDRSLVLIGVDPLHDGC